MTESDDRPSMTDEVLRLAGAAQDWVRENFPTGPDGHMGAECQWCPLCQFMAVLRGERPDLTERVAETGAALGSALRALFDGAAPRASEQQPDSPRVQRIDLDEPPE